MQKKIIFLQYYLKHDIDQHLSWYTFVMLATFAPYTFKDRVGSWILKRRGTAHVYNYHLYKIHANCVQSTHACQHVQYLVLGL